MTNALPTFGAITAAGLLSLTLSFNVQADPWEPGFNTSISHTPSYEVEGASRNSMDGSLTGLTLNYASSSMVPTHASVYYAQGSSDHVGEQQFDQVTADDHVLDVRVGVGKSYETGGIEVVPFAGLGFYEMRQSFEGGPVAADNDIATTTRKHRYLYTPLGFYVGSTSDLDMVNIFYQATLKPVLIGEAKIGSGDDGVRMNIGNGFGFELETGFHFPTSGSWNIFTSIYFKQWDIHASRLGARVENSNVTTVKDTSTDHEELGIKLGVQF